MAVIDSSRDLPESCEKCWKRDCSIYGTEWGSIFGTDTYRNSRAKNCPLKEVNDKPSGKWILDDSDNSITCCHCNCMIWASDICNGEPHYCPNCGAKMVEPQERIEKE